MKVNIKADDIKLSEFIKILSLTDYGASDLISTRGKAYKNLNINIKHLKLNELIHIVEANRQLLRHPIIIDRSCVQIGSNLEETRCFIPKLQRRIQPPNF